MRMRHSIFLTLCMGIAPLMAIAAPIAQSASSVQPISQYGLIQNVQNYSSNPFWNPNGPYNQRMPQPIYVQGADLNTADCQRTVGTLVAAYCVENNNCVGMRVSDVRPVMMLQLARLPGHNYATSCSGFIDTEFDSYVSKYSNAGPSNAYTAFPNATAPNPNLNETEFKIENPYQIKNRTWNNENWEEEKKERSRELRELQAQNGPDYINLARADFPKTADDLTFTERMELQSAGYEPWKNATPYAQPFQLESEQDARNRQQQYRSAFCSYAQREMLNNMNDDLETLKDCRTKGTPFAQCKLRGVY